MTRILLGLIASLVLATSIVGCSTASDPVEISSDTIIIDVRTPAEYATGHLDGAKLIDFNSGEFAATLPHLDPAAEYALYCKSGNRSGQAAAILSEAGFANVIDLGSLGDAATSTRIAVVQ